MAGLFMAASCGSYFTSTIAAAITAAVNSSANVWLTLSGDGRRNRLRRLGRDGSRRDAGLLQRAEHVHERLQLAVFVARNDDRHFRLSAEGAQLIGQIPDGRWIAVQVNAAVRRQSNRNVPHLVDLGGHARMRKGYLQTESRQHVNADEHEKHQQKHHHVDHRDDLNSHGLVRTGRPGAHYRTTGGVAPTAKSGAISTTPPAVLAALRRCSSIPNAVSVVRNSE